jgi:hypothetical protein
VHNRSLKVAVKGPAVRPTPLVCMYVRMCVCMYVCGVLNDAFSINTV